MTLRGARTTRGFVALLEIVLASTAMTGSTRSAPGDPAEPAAETRPAAEPRRGPTLKVLQWNIDGAKDNYGEGELQDLVADCVGNVLLDAGPGC